MRANCLRANKIGVRFSPQMAITLSKHQYSFRETAMKKRKPFSVILSAFIIVCCCLAGLPSLSDRNSNQTNDNVPDTSNDVGGSNGLQIERTRIVPVTTTRRPTVTSVPAPEISIKVNQANLRSGPGTGYPTVSTLTRGTVLQVIATDESGGWYNVTWPNGEHGWIWHENVEATNSLSNIRVAATIPALPTSNSGVAAPTSQPAAPAPTNPPPPVCDCSGDNYSCGSFNSQRAAQACFNYCMPISGDIHRLDGDNDGRVCE
jgi:hypothetical protein